jgi:DNA-binding response OmpR family regulator
MTILVVDDEAHIRQMMRLTLEAAAYRVIDAATGEEGLTVFGDGHDIDAVVLDQKMPGLDGLATLRRILERKPDACVLMVTAFASIELAVDAMRLGATDFLRKPMTPETLRGALLAALVGRARQTPRPASPAHPAVPRIETLTLNGFRIFRDDAHAGAPAEHRFRVAHADAPDVLVTVSIDPEAVARVARLTKHALQSGGAFWHEQAERLLAAFLWSEGRAPERGRLVVRDVSREDLDLAAAWTSD